MVEDKVYSAMRSLFRLTTMKQSNFPDIIIENEKSLLKKRFDDLEADDIEYVVNNWETFFKHEKVSQGIKDEIMMQDLNKEFKKLN